MHENKKIPEFKSYEEMTEFWDSHSVADYWDQTEPAEFEIADNVRRRYLVSVDRELFGRVQRVARTRGLSTESLVKWCCVYFHSEKYHHGQKNRGVSMREFNRITFDRNIMGGRACIRGMRVTVSLIVNLVANGMATEEIIDAYPYLEPEDINQALEYVAWLAEETVHPMELYIAAS